MKPALFVKFPLTFWLALLLPAIAVLAGAQLIHLAGRAGFTDISSAEQP